MELKEQKFVSKNGMSEGWTDFLKKIKWHVVITITILHICAFRGFYLLVAEAKWQTIATCYILVIMSAIGIMAGVHRLFSHRSYKANRKLTFILCVFQTLSGQLSIIEWSLDHITHHKFEGTNADAVNLNRGFFFAHIGWFFMDRHPECEQKRQKLDINYLWSDPIVKFQHHFYWPLFLIINIMIPTLIPYILFDESLEISFYTCFAFRYMYTTELSLSGLIFEYFIHYLDKFNNLEKASYGDPKYKKVQFLFRPVF